MWFVRKERLASGLLPYQVLHGPYVVSSCEQKCSVFGGYTGRYREATPMAGRCKLFSSSVMLSCAFDDFRSTILLDSLYCQRDLRGSTKLSIIYLSTQVHGWLPRRRKRCYRRLFHAGWALLVSGERAQLRAPIPHFVSPLTHRRDARNDVRYLTHVGRLTHCLN